MTDPALRLLLVALVLVVGIGGGVLARRRFTYHPPLDIAGLDFAPGLVVFTSTNCERCKEVLAVAKATAAPLREVTFELEPGLQDQVGVTGVPVTLVIGRSGQVVSQLAGSVSRRRLRSALRRAGL